MSDQTIGPSYLVWICVRGWLSKFICLFVCLPVSLHDQSGVW